MKALRRLVGLAIFSIGFLPALAFSQSLYFVQVDHINTPRLIENASQQAVWRWEQWEPFGLNPADENPAGLGAFEFPLRFPGQYFDKETNLHFNYFRDYDSQIGRYVQSDPIGLRGGINTYAYVGSKPITLADPLGLYDWSLPQGVVDVAAGFGDSLSFGVTALARKAMGTNDAVNFCSVEYYGGVLAGVTVHIVGFRTGGELAIGQGFRLAPWGNRTSHQYGELPHYHRRIADASGNTVPGGSMNWHRPWEKGW